MTSTQFWELDPFSPCLHFNQIYGTKSTQPSPQCVEVFSTAVHWYSHHNMIFCHDNETSDDARNRVGL